MDYNTDINPGGFVPPSLYVTVKHFNGQSVTERMDAAFLLDAAEFVRAAQQMGGKAAARLMRALDDRRVLAGFKLARRVRERERGPVARLVAEGLLNYCPELWGAEWARLSPAGALELERLELDAELEESKARQEQMNAGLHKLGKQNNYDLEVMRRYSTMTKIERRDYESLDRLYHKGLIRVSVDMQAELTDLGSQVLRGMKPFPHFTHILDALTLSGASSRERVGIDFVDPTFKEKIKEPRTGWTHPAFQDGAASGPAPGNPHDPPELPLTMDKTAQRPPERAKRAESGPDVSKFPALDKYLTDYLAAVRTLAGYRLPAGIHDFDLRYLQSLGYVEYWDHLDKWNVTGLGVAYLDYKKSQEPAPYNGSYTGLEAAIKTIQANGLIAVVKGIAPAANIVGDGEFLLRLLGAVGVLHAPYPGYKAAWDKLLQLCLIGYSARDGGHVLTGAGHVELSKIFEDFPEGTVERADLKRAGSAQPVERENEAGGPFTDGDKNHEA